MWPVPVLYLACNIVPNTTWRSTRSWERPVKRWRKHFVMLVSCYRRADLGHQKRLLQVGVISCPTIHWITPALCWWSRVVQRPRGLQQPTRSVWVQREQAEPMLRARHAQACADGVIRLTIVQRSLVRASA